VQENNKRSVFDFIGKAENAILTAEDVAELLNVSERSVRDALNDGSLKGYKKFNRWYVFYQDVVNFIRS
jgi:excisionase family DNA binding protein